MLVKKLLKPVITVLFVVMYCQATHSQANEDNFAKIIDFLPPAPNTAAIEKAGLFNLNKNTGAPNISIPLFDLKGKKLGLNVSLNYSTNGIKVDEIASRVGMGWTLNAGGVITRTVRGRADEKNTRRYPTGTPTDNWLTYFYMKDITDPAQVDWYDGEPDMFNFNFNGTSGSFVFDSSGNIVVVPFSNIKVESNFTSSNWNFKITGTDGVKYYFGGDSATEKTKRLQSCGKTFDSFLPTSWYLTKIEHPNGDTITLNYKSAPVFDYDNGISQTQVWGGQGMGNGWGVECVSQPPAGIVSNTSCINYTETKGFLLDEITAGFEKLKFTYGSRSDCDDKIITKIKQFAKIGTSATLIKSYTFTYTNYGHKSYNTLDVVGGDVPYLTALAESGTDSTKTLKHYFQYKDPAGRCARLSFAQDHWGFFNGKNNTTLLPVVADVATKFPDATANREPDFDYAVKGMLTRIIYPTGGIQQIFYEQNGIGTYINTVPYHEYTCNVTGTGTGTGPHDEVSKTIPFSVDHTQNVLIDIDVVCNSTCESVHNRGTVEIFNSLGASIFHSNEPTGYSQTVSATVSSGSYNLVISAGGSPVTTNIKLKYYPYNVSTSVDNLATGGVRVKEILTGNPGETPMYKRYYYGDITSLNSSSLIGVRIPKYYKNYQKKVEYPPAFAEPYNIGGGGGACYRYMVSLHSNSLRTLFDYGGALTSYTTVVESNGDNFLGGGIISRFNAELDQPGQVLMGNDILNATNTNTSILINAKPTEETILKKFPDGTLLPTKTTLYTYNTVFENDIAGYVVNRGLTTIFTPDTTCAVPSACAINRFLEGYDMIKYHIWVPWTQTSEVQEIIYDETGQNPVTNTTDYYYDSSQYQQVTRTITLNSKGDTIKKFYKYPYDFPSESVYQSMVNKNILSPVIEVESKVNAVTTEETKTNYFNWELNNFEPVTYQQAAKGNTLETKGTITARNSDGNILEYRGVDSIINSIIWGYNYSYPVAKIENSTYRADTAALHVSMAALQALDGQALKDELNRIRTQISEANVTTYTYKPLVGVTSITDKNNKTNSFQYDVFNRLYTVRDQDSNLVKKTEYTYANPDTASALAIYINDSITQYFSCENCASGTHATPIPYTIAKGRFVSLISLADANDKALLELLTKGQLNANSLGMCSNTICTGVDYKFIGCACEKGVKNCLYTSQNPDSSWTITYRYDWSDGSHSSNITDTIPPCTGSGKKKIDCDCEMGSKVCDSTTDHHNGTYTLHYHYHWSDNTTSSPVTETITCNDPDKRLINCDCKTGLKIYITSTNNGPDCTSPWECTFQYHWSAGPPSDIYTECNENPCSVD